MGYEYDSKVNRDLAKTAMAIYAKSHEIAPINESTESHEVINEEVLRENVNSLILNYVSDVIVLAEQHLGREMTDVEINEASIELLNRINSISDEDKTAFVTELAEAHGAAMQQAAPMDTSAGGGSGMGTARPGAAAKPGMRPAGGQDAGKGRANAVAMTPTRADGAVEAEEQVPFGVAMTSLFDSEEFMNASNSEQGMMIANLLAQY